MITFKEQLEKDIEDTFFNSNEFAELVRVWYQGNMYEIPVSIDQYMEVDRKIYSDDHAEGINQIDLVAYIPKEKLGVIPRKGRRFEIEDENGIITEYTIVKSNHENGVIILYLQEYEE